MSFVVINWHSLHLMYHEQMHIQADCTGSLLTGLFDSLVMQYVLLQTVHKFSMHN